MCLFFGCWLLHMSAILKMKFSDKKRPKNKATKLVIEFDEKKRAYVLYLFIWLQSISECRVGER